MAFTFSRPIGNFGFQPLFWYNDFFLRDHIAPNIVMRH